MSPSVRPASDTDAYAVSSCDIAVMPGPDPFVTDTSTSIYVGGATSGCATPTEHIADVSTSICSPIRSAADATI